MSKFSKGDLVTVDWVDEDERALGLVNMGWSKYPSKRTGVPLVRILLLEDGHFIYLDEDEVELALGEYEFAVMSIDLEDFGQTHVGANEWGTLEEAEKLIQATMVEDTEGFYQDDRQLQINRRRKVGPSIGHSAV